MGKGFIRAKRLERAMFRAYREDARVKQNSCCDYCGDKITALSVTGDHVKARKNGGRDERNNIVAACRDCNVLKGHMLSKDFRARIRKPRKGDDLRFHIRWAHKRINDRLKRMERNLCGA